MTVNSPQQMSSTLVSIPGSRRWRKLSAKQLAKCPRIWARCIHGLLRSTIERARLGAFAIPTACRPYIERILLFSPVQSYLLSYFQYSRFTWIKSMSCSAISLATRSCASRVDAPKCGVEITAGCWINRREVPPSTGGSWPKTSRAAPRQRPVVKAS